MRLRVPTWRCVVVLAVSLSALALLTPTAAAQEPARHGIAADLTTYPQSTPQTALASILKAIENRRIDYLVAHLADPAYVDDRVSRLYGGKFDEQVADTAARLDPGAVKLLQRLVKEGEWKVADNEALLTAKAIENRSVYLKKVGGRWFLENKQSP